MEDEYLGDGVYASFDGHQIWLDTRASAHSDNKIALDSEVFFKLMAYQKKILAENS